MDYVLLMLEIPAKLKSLFTSKVVEIDGDYYVKLPDSEVDYGSAEEGEEYRCALIDPSVRDQTSSDEDRDSTHSNTNRGSTPSSSPHDDHQHHEGPPVSKGEEIQVEIESTGDEGDGVARVDRGYVVMVEDASPGDNPLVEIESVKQNVAFASVVEYNTPRAQ